MQGHHPLYQPAVALVGYGYGWSWSVGRELAQVQKRQRRCA
jgi:hypothetical protein